jgi:hypothetical protein
MPEPTTDRPPCPPATSPVRAYVAAALLCVAVLGLTSLHARQAHRRALTDLARAWGQAGQVIESEAKAGELTDRIRELSRDLERRERSRSSIEVSAVTATLVNRLPDTATLDRLALRVGVEAGGEVLRGDAAGFATSLEDLEVLAVRLEDTPFEDVSVEERLGHARSLGDAVGFGLTFRIQMDADPRETLSAEVAGEPGPEGAVR